MTGIYELDGKRLSEPETAHPYLKELLELPDYYGMNADALYDCLTERTEDAMIFISDSGAVHPKLAQTFSDASESNPMLRVIFEE